MSDSGGVTLERAELLCVFCRQDCFELHLFHQRMGPMCFDCHEQRKGAWSTPKWTRNRRRVEISRGRIRVIYSLDDKVFRAMDGSQAVLAIPSDAIELLLRVVNDPESRADDVRDELFA